MNLNPDSRFYASYLKAQYSPPPRGDPVTSEGDRLPSITISRQAGARGNTVARLTVESLNKVRPPETPVWTLFNRDLMREILTSHQLPSELERFFPEAHLPEWQSMVDSLLNNRPDPWTVFEYSCDTIRSLLRCGHCIIVGRCAHLVGADFPNVLHIRLIGSSEKRLAHIMELCPGNIAKTRRWLEKTDRDRRTYARYYFNHDIDDPKDYSAVFSTDHLSPKAIADAITSLALDLKPHPIFQQGVIGQHHKSSA